MAGSNFNRIAAVAGIAALAGLSSCASSPNRINNMCAVFDQNDGYVTNWRRSARAVETKYGIPVPVLMATIRKESGFKHNARPPRTYYLGFIPGKRASSAFGYSQALDGTWDQYRKETGSWAARRNNFADAVDFVGWYHQKTVDTFGVKPGDTYNLYLAYYSGWGAYGKGSWRSNASIMKYAQATAKMAVDYDAQLQTCGD